MGYSEVWPIHLTDYNGDDKEVMLELGDALFYKGCAVPHWRNKFEGEWAHQVFLHWASIETVKSHDKLTFDGRDQLGGGKRKYTSFVSNTSI